MIIINRNRYARDSSQYLMRITAIPVHIDRGTLNLIYVLAADTNGILHRAANCTSTCPLKVQSEQKLKAPQAT